MRITLRQVAERAGVSTSTVSRVLSGEKETLRVPISAETRERVNRAVAELGYRPNRAARSLAKHGSFNLIGAIMPRYVPHVLSHPFCFTILQAMADYCQEHEYGVVVSFVELDATPDEYARLVALPVDGFVLTTTRQVDTILQHLHDDEIPFVHIGRYPGSLPYKTDFVDVDNYLGARLATEHLVQLGHQRIATITGQLSMAAGVDRLRAYRDALGAAGLGVDPSLIAEGDFDEESGYRRMLQLLDISTRPTAVFAASDAMAIGAMRALRERGLGAGKDVAIVGYDDAPGVEQLNPPLTTVRQPVSELGEAAARLLIHLVSGEEERPKHLLSPILIVRSSSGAADP